MVIKGQRMHVEILILHVPIIILWYNVNSDNTPEALLATKNSGIAFYVDLHAHATKRGVFMCTSS
jgi:hypothetical protein